jgi:hypothetical protein
MRGVNIGYLCLNLGNQNSFRRALGSSCQHCDRLRQRGNLYNNPGKTSQLTSTRAEGDISRAACTSENRLVRGPLNRKAITSPPTAPERTAKPASAESRPWVAHEIERRTGKETRAFVLGHLQRGWAPAPVDPQLCTRFGWSLWRWLLRACSVIWRPSVRRRSCRRR